MAQVAQVASIAMTGNGEGRARTTGVGKHTQRGTGREDSERVIGGRLRAKHHRAPERLAQADGAL